MNTQLHHLLLAATFSLALPTLAQDAPPATSTSGNEPMEISPVEMQSSVKPRKIRWSHEVDIESGYTFSSKTKQGDAVIGNIDSFNSGFSYVATGKFDKNFLGRFGVKWDRYSMGLDRAMKVPNTLQSTAVIAGFDVSVGDKWLLRFEAQPGVYSDFNDVTTNQINVPLVFGGSYLYSDRFQIMFGVFVDFFGNPFYGMGIRDSFPVFPAIGFRWQITDDLTLLALPPKPRLTYAINESLSVYGGGQLLGGSFRTGPSYGNNVGQPNLNDSLVDYSEIRGGAGIGWNITPGISLELDGGYSLKRSLTYHRARLEIDADPAPYVNLSVSGKF